MDCLHRRLPNAWSCWFSLMLFPCRREVAKHGWCLNNRESSKGWTWLWLDFKLFMVLWKIMTVLFIFCLIRLKVSVSSALDPVVFCSDSLHILSFCIVLQWQVIAKEKVSEGRTLFRYIQMWEVRIQYLCILPRRFLLVVLLDCVCHDGVYVLFNYFISAGTRNILYILGYIFATTSGVQVLG